MSTLPTQATAPLYAGFWRRAAAALVDNLVLLLPSFAINYALGTSNPFLNLLLQLAIAVAYYALMHSSSWQATLGKRAFGIKVADLQGNRISPLRGVGRYFAVFISAIPLCLGFLLAAFTERKQALHDMIAGTLVVNAKALPEEIPAGSGTMPLTVGVWLAVGLMLLFPFGAGMLAAIAIPAYQDYVKRAKARQVLLVPLPMVQKARQIKAEPPERGAFRV